VNYRFSHTTTLIGKLIMVAGMLPAPHASAQSKAEPLTFEVASVKPGDPDVRPRGGGPVSGGGLRIVCMPLKWIIMFAYDMNEFQVSGGPAWIESQGFDIVAKAPGAAASETRLPTAEEHRQARLRLQALLAERFQLVVRRETKDTQVYALLIAKNGFKMKASAGESRGLRQSESGEMTGIATRMEILTKVLSRVIGHPVLDKTGLTGSYDFTLKFAPELTGGGLEKPGSGVGTLDMAAPSIFTALQEQLGLKLESQKAPAEFIVIERVARPTPN